MARFVSLPERLNKMSSNNKLTKLTWFNIILFGFMGQVAWAVENVYFNTFLFNYIGGNVNDISNMVAASAATAVITTILMGALSDKLGSRKFLLSVGYIVWGFSVFCFAFINRENVGNLFGLSDTAAIIAATVSVVIIMDCVMTFFGSTANDAAFNAWITDATNISNRGTVEAVLGIFPVFATVIVSVAFGILVDSFGYSACFIGLGAIVALCGLIGVFTLKEPSKIQKSDESYLKSLVYGFKPSIIKKNKQLYIILTAASIFNIAVQIFMPYIFIYLQHYLGFDMGNLNITPKFIIIALVAIVAVVGGLIGMGKMVDKIGKTQFVLISAAFFIVGLVAVSFADKLGVFAILAIIMLAGYGLLMIILNSSVRDFTPEGMAGRFQGVRMLFVVFIPMVIGPKVGSAVIERFSQTTYTNEYLETVAAPTPEMFLASAVIAVFIFIPLIAVRKQLKSVKF